jgi:hypothetical protein
MALVFLLLAACGGSDSSPLLSANYPSTAPVGSVVSLNGSGSTASNGGTLTYSWVLTGRPTGSSATIVNPTAAQATLTPDVVGTYTITFTVSVGSKSQSTQTTLTATAYTPPTILSDLVEPVSGTVQLSLSTDPGTATVSWTVDGTALAATGAAVSWNTTTFTDGGHVVIAQLQSTGYVVNVTRTFQTKQSTVSFTSATISESAGVFTAVVGAQSANGILGVSATLDGVAIGTLAAPNSCVDPNSAVCTAVGPYDYAFSGSVGSGAHVVVVTATDGIGNTLGTQLRLTVTDVP